VEDPATKRHQPRNYLETLEARIALLEDQLRPISPDISGSSKSRDEDDGASHLSSKVGMLGLRMDGVEPHYLGSSSAFAFSRLIHSSLRQVISGNHPDLFGVNEDTPKPSPCPLPDYEFGITLSNAYFQNIHPQYPFLHEPTFRVWEAKLLGPSESIDPLSFDPIPLFFLNMVSFVVGFCLKTVITPYPRYMRLVRYFCPILDPYHR
jgi:hypothetical protein